MLVCVVFRCFFRVVRGMQVMAMRDVGVVPGFFVVAGTVVLGRLPVVVGCAFVVFRSFCVVFRAGLAHRANEGCLGSRDLLR